MQRGIEVPADERALGAAAGLPGGAFEVALLHYAMDGLPLDPLTTSVDAGFDADEVFSAFVARLVAGVAPPPGRAHPGRTPTA
ncbi:hypothetical protein [Micromonospora musae]|uniref:hypothetical protein n=1 Tax=Micromonospora musae TaxID=1894970 RepID=UPI0033FEB868